MECLEIDITNLQLHTSQSWIYLIIDQERQKIIHLGSTWLHPIARTEKHITNGLLNGLGNNEHLKLMSFSLPDTLERKMVKKALMHRLDQSLFDFNTNTEEGEFETSKDMEALINDIYDTLSEKLQFL